MPHWIEIRKEVHDMLHGSNGEPPQGRWAVLQWFDPSQKSKYFNPKTGEAIGGPAYKYQRYAIRTTSDMGNLFLRTQNGSIAKGTYPEELDLGAEVYLIEHCYYPKIGDWILEYECEYPDKVEDFIKLARVHPAIKWKIRNVKPVRVDGKIVYYLVLAQVEQGHQ